MTEIALPVRMETTGLRTYLFDSDNQTLAAGEIVYAAEIVNTLNEHADLPQQLQTALERLAEVGWRPIRGVEDLPTQEGLYLVQFRHPDRLKAFTIRPYSDCSDLWVEVYEAYLLLPEPYIKQLSTEGKV